MRKKRKQHYVRIMEHKGDVIRTRVRLRAFAAHLGWYLNAAVGDMLSDRKE